MCLNYKKHSIFVVFSLLMTSCGSEQLHTVTDASEKTAFITHAQDCVPLVLSTPKYIDSQNSEVHNPARHALDQDAETRWSAKFQGLEKQPQGVWLKTELPHQYEVCGIQVRWWFNPSGSKDRRFQFTVLGSSQALTPTSQFSTLLSKRLSGSKKKMDHNGFEFYGIQNGKNLKAIQISGYGNSDSGNDWFSVSEIKIYVKNKKKNSRFVHPGIMNSSDDLNRLRRRFMNANQKPEKMAQPFQGAYQKLLRKRHQNGKVPANLNCDKSNNSNRKVCIPFQNAAEKAYAAALVWAHTGRQDDANKAIGLLNEISGKFQSIQDDKRKQSLLVSGWLLQYLPRAAEIMRHHKVNGKSSGWSKQDAQKFGKTLNVLAQYVHKGYTIQYQGKKIPNPYWASNWQFAFASGMINVGIYNEDRQMFDEGRQLLKYILHKGFYFAKDHPSGKPQIPNKIAKENRQVDYLNQFWWGQHYFDEKYNGFNGETCRDQNHPQSGLTMLNASIQTLSIQDALSELLKDRGAERIVVAQEFQMKILNIAHQYNTKTLSSSQLGLKYLCHKHRRADRRGQLIDLSYWGSSPELFYSFAKRGVLGEVKMPETKKALKNLRSLYKRKSDLYSNNISSSFEVLTHGLNILD